jgi:hypothetical protein
MGLARRPRLAVCEDSVGLALPALLFLPPSRLGVVMHVFLDRQHFGKPPPNDKDRGVEVDLDGDGDVDSQEAMLTPLYIAAAKAHLEAQGHTVTVVEQGTYPDRHAQVCALAKALPTSQRPAAYVACHLNAGHGSYGLVVHDGRSSGGKRMADRVRAALRAEFTAEELSKVLVEAGQSGDWTRNAYNTIKGIYAGPSFLAGLCYEPVFVDTHRGLLSPANLDRMGVALAKGLIAWSQPDGPAMAFAVAPDPLIHDGRVAAERDARVDPESGDLVVTARGQARQVMGVRDGRVYYRSWPVASRTSSVTLEAWTASLERGAMIEVARW